MGCVVFYKNMDPKRNKLRHRGIKYVFVGYTPNIKAYRLLDLESNVIIEFYMWNFENLITEDKEFEIPTY